MAWAAAAAAVLGTAGSIIADSEKSKKEAAAKREMFLRQARATKTNRLMEDRSKFMDYDYGGVNFDSMNFQAGGNVDRDNTNVIRNVVTDADRKYVKKSAHKNRKENSKEVIENKKAYERGLKIAKMTADNIVRYEKNPTGFVNKPYIGAGVRHVKYFGVDMYTLVQRELRKNRMVNSNTYKGYKYRSKHKIHKDPKFKGSVLYGNRSLNPFSPSGVDAITGADYANGGFIDVDNNSQLAVNEKGTTQGSHETGNDISFQNSQGRNVKLEPGEVLVDGDYALSKRNPSPANSFADQYLKLKEEAKGYIEDAKRMPDRIQSNLMMRKSAMLEAKAMDVKGDQEEFNANNQQPGYAEMETNEMRRGGSVEDPPKKKTHLYPDTNLYPYADYTLNDIEKHLQARELSKDSLYRITDGGVPNIGILHRLQREQGDSVTGWPDKDRIYLHKTGSDPNIKDPTLGEIRTLNNDTNVPYYIARNGVAYNFYDHALGFGGVRSNKEGYDKYANAKGIGIEFAASAESNGLNQQELTPAQIKQGKRLMTVLQLKGGKNYIPNERVISHAQYNRESGTSNHIDDISDASRTAMNLGPASDAAEYLKTTKVKGKKSAEGVVKEAKVSDKSTSTANKSLKSGDNEVFQKNSNSSYHTNLMNDFPIAPEVPSSHRRLTREETEAWKRKQEGEAIAATKNNTGRLTKEQSIDVKKQKLNATTAEVKEPATADSPVETTPNATRTNNITREAHRPDGKFPYKSTSGTNATTANNTTNDLKSGDAPSTTNSGNASMYIDNIANLGLLAYDATKPVSKFPGAPSVAAPAFRQYNPYAQQGRISEDIAKAMADIDKNTSNSQVARAVKAQLLTGGLRAKSEAYSKALDRNVTNYNQYQTSLTDINKTNSLLQYDRNKSEYAEQTRRRDATLSGVSGVMANLGDDITTQKNYDLQRELANTEARMIGATDPDNALRIEAEKFRGNKPGFIEWAMTTQRKTKKQAEAAAAKYGI